MRLVRFSCCCCALLCVVQPCRAGSTDSLVVSFEAVISEVEGDAEPLDMPFQLGIGDRIEGKITFDSREEALSIFSGKVGNFAALELQLGNSTIQNLFNIGLVNNSFFLDGEPVEDIDNPTSSISLGYLPPTDGIPGWAGSGLDVPWNAGLLLVGEPGTIETPEGLLNFDDWNRLDRLRELTLDFGYPDTVKVTATLGDFIAVPEPSSLAIAVFGFLGLASRGSLS